MLVRQNMHTHTRLSYCGGRDSTVANTVAEADSVGLELVGISDHIDEEGSGREALVAQNRDELAGILASNKKPRVRVLIGAEVSLLAPDRLSATREGVAAMDYVVISCNHFHLHVVDQPADRTEDGYADRFLDMVEGAIGFGASIIPHPFSYIGTRKRGDGAPIDLARLLAAYDRGRIRQVFRLAAAKGTAFELNPGYVRPWPDFFAGIIRMARDEGVRFSLGSDGHHPGNMHYGGPEKIAEVDAFFRSIGLEERDVCQEYAVRG